MSKRHNPNPRIIPDTPGANRSDDEAVQDEVLQRQRERPADSDTQDVDPDSAESENNRDDTVDAGGEAG